APAPPAATRCPPAPPPAACSRPGRRPAGTARPAPRRRRGPPGCRWRASFALLLAPPGRFLLERGFSHLLPADECGQSGRILDARLVAQLVLEFVETQVTHEPPPRATPSTPCTSVSPS